MHRHAGSHFAKLLELVDPKVFIQIQIAVVGLRGAGVGAEKIQNGAVGEHNRVTAQFHFGHIPRKRQNVLLEHMRLRLTGGEEYLVAPGINRIQQRFMGKVVSRTDLPRFEDVADTVA